MRYRFYIEGQRSLQYFEQSGENKTEIFRKAKLFLEDWHLPKEGLDPEEIQENGECTDVNVSSIIIPIDELDEYCEIVLRNTHQD